MSNFTFLKTQWPDIWEQAIKAEQYPYTEPVASGFFARKALEVMTDWLYANSVDLAGETVKDLHEKLANIKFKALVGRPIVNECFRIKEVGNESAHRNNVVEPEEALDALRSLFAVATWLQSRYGSPGGTASSQRFDDKLVPRDPIQAGSEVRPGQIEPNITELHDKIKSLTAALNSSGVSRDDIERLKSDLAETKIQCASANQRASDVAKQLAEHKAKPQVTRQQAQPPNAANANVVAMQAMIQRRTDVQNARVAAQARQKHPINADSRQALSVLVVVIASFFVAAFMWNAYAHSTSSQDQARAASSNDHGSSPTVPADTPHPSHGDSQHVARSHRKNGSNSITGTGRHLQSQQSVQTSARQKVIRESDSPAHQQSRSVSSGTSPFDEPDVDLHSNRSKSSGDGSSSSDDDNSDLHSNRGHSISP